MAPDPSVGAPRGVGLTALGIAYVRAMESKRSDRLFDDPLASEFVAASGWQPPSAAAPVGSGPGRFFAAVRAGAVVRTRFLDDFLTAACGNGCGQAVLLGAGLDTRAFRLHLPQETQLFELDLSDLLQFKQGVLDSTGASPHCKRTAVGCDLREDWPSKLLGAGLDAELPTAWIAEGLLIYLTRSEVDRLLDRVGALSAPGSQLGLTLASAGWLERSRAWLDERGGEPDPGVDRLDGPPRGRSPLSALWQSAAPDDPRAWLDRRGWSAQAFDAFELAAAYGRPLPGGDKEQPSPSGWLVSATRV
jgi:methyltransferase (TIGR00027 family)